MLLKEKEHSVCAKKSQNLGYAPGKLKENETNLMIYNQFSLTDNDRD